MPVGNPSGEFSRLWKSLETMRANAAALSALLGELSKAGVLDSPAVNRVLDAMVPMSIRCERARAKAEAEKEAEDGA